MEKPCEDAFNQNAGSESGTEAGTLMRKGIHYYAMKAHEPGNETYFEKLSMGIGAFGASIDARYNIAMFIGQQLELAGEIGASKLLLDLAAAVKPLEGNAFLGVWHLHRGHLPDAIACFAAADRRAVKNEDKLSSLMMLARAYAINSQYKEAEQAIEAGMLLSEKVKDLARTNAFAAERDAIRLFRDKRIRHEAIDNPDAVLALKTAYKFLQTFEIGEECDFTPVLSQISKGLEITLHDKLGKPIKNRLHSEQQALLADRMWYSGQNKLHPLVYKFIFNDDQLTLGNWLYLSRSILDNKNEPNGVQRAIVALLQDSVKGKDRIIEAIAATAGKVNPDRGSYVHQEILTKGRLDAFLTETTTLINDLIFALVSPVWCGALTHNAGTKFNPHHVVHRAHEAREGNSI